MIEKVKEFMVAAGQDVPEFPTASTPERRINRIRMLLEEVFETADAAGVELTFNEEYPLSLDYVTYSSNPAKFNFKELVDGLTDVDYITKGGFADIGIDPEPMFEAVHKNNMTKFEDGYRDENGKWRKGPSYRPVELEPLIAAQIAGEPPWVPYSAEEAPLDIPDEKYKDKQGNVFYFSSGPRDKMIWRLTDGRIDKGIPKNKFYKYFSPV